MIKFRIYNQRAGLEKTVDVTEYTREQRCKLFEVYTKARFSVYVVEGIEEMLKNKKDIK